MVSPDLLMEHTKNLAVLYVEDDLQLRQSTNEMWEMLFKKVDLAADGQEGLDLYQANTYDIVITDISMPNMDGLELITEIFKLNDAQKVIVLSAHNDTKYLLQMIELGISNFITKPFNSKQLFKMLFEVASSITDKKNLDFYHAHIEKLSLELEEKNRDLEHALEYYKEERIKSKPSPSDEPTVEVEISQEKLEDIRHNQVEKINAYDFCDSLDEGTMNKIDLFLQDIDGLILSLYDLEDGSGGSFEDNKRRIINLFNDIFHIIDLMAVFPIITRSFSSLVDFIEGLDEEKVAQESKRKLLAQSLRGLSDDFEGWVKMVFLDKTTDDIHYFDASFASNCLAIESAFNDEEIASDEDDLEFF